MAVCWNCQPSWQVFNTFSSVGDRGYILEVVHNNVCAETHTQAHTCTALMLHSMHDYHPSWVKAHHPPVLDFSSLTVTSIYHEVTSSGLSSFHKLTEINSPCQTKYPSSSDSLLTTGAFILSDILQRVSQKPIRSHS